MTASSFNLIPTQDGSLTLYDAATRQHYHNRAGAYTEALKNYVEPSGVLDWGLRQETLVVLDACYGLGYNSWTLLNELLREKKQAPGARLRHIALYLVESNPNLFSLTKALLDQDCYNCIGNKPEIAATLEAVSKNNNRVPLTFNFALSSQCQVSFYCYTQDIREVVQQLNGSQRERFDLVFHDPFSPNRAPHLWSVELFKHYHDSLKKEGPLLTYSLASAVRAGLLEAGFHLMKSQGVGDKTGGTVAFKTQPPMQEMIAARGLSRPFTREEAIQISGRSGVPYRDATLSDAPETVLKRREAEQAKLS
ncbi:MAG: MnmC family methyltransferase [Vampirovibrionales bacterium]|nr:MnmC family methyltransferase [Vampirovibrionales bacterium]